MVRKISVVLIFVLWLANAYAQTSSLAKVGTAGFQFLKFSQGARGLAMGDAFNPVADDASAVFWNPALLNNVENYSAFATHSQYLADITVEGFAVSKNFRGIGVIGFNMVYMDVGSIEETTVMEQAGTGRTFNPNGYGIGISFARMLTDKFGIGTNIKYVREDLTSGLGMDNATTAWSIDLGTIYRPNFKDLESLRITMAVKNFGPEVQLKGTYFDYDNGTLVEDDPADYKFFPLPLTFEFGVAMEPIETDQHRLTLAVVGVHPNDNLERVNLGAEYEFMKMFALRGGYVVNHDTRTLNAGAGLNLNLFGNSNVRLDYGYAHFGILNDIQVFSFSFDW